MSAVPTRIRNDSASILMVGWLSTKSLMARAANIITSTAITIASAITATCSTRPTAVITESSENTMSMTAIWISTPAKEATARCCALSVVPSRLAWISLVLFTSRNSPPPSRIRSRPEISWPRSPNSGVLRLITHTSDSSRARRVIMASARPSTRALWRWRAGKRPTRMEMKIMLSMPRTISRAVSVASAAQACGSESHSIRGLRMSVSCPAGRRGASGSVALFAGVLGGALGDLVHDREQHAREYEGEVNADLPGELLVLDRPGAERARGADVADVDERLEELDGGDRDDRGDHLDLEAGEIDLAHPVRAVLVARGVDFGHEVLIAAENDDEEQVRDQRHVHQRQDHENDIGLRGAQDMRHEVDEFLAELDEQDQYTADQPEIERRQQPAAVEYQDFQRMFDSFHVTYAQSCLYAGFNLAELSRY